MEKSLEMQALPGSSVPEEAGLAPGLAPSGPPESLGMERMKKRPQRRRLGVYWLAAGKAKWKSWTDSKGRKLCIREVHLGHGSRICGTGEVAGCSHGAKRCADVWSCSSRLCG